MFNYISLVTQFIESNFTVVNNPDEANVKFTNNQFLSFLFDIFPDGCITDYDLNEIMTKLGHTRHTYKMMHETENKDGKKTITYSLLTGWCINSIVLNDI